METTKGTTMVDWDSPTWGNVVHVDEHGSWLDVEATTESEAS